MNLTFLIFRILCAHYTFWVLGKVQKENGWILITRLMQEKTDSSTSENKIVCVCVCAFRKTILLHKHVVPLLIPAVCISGTP